MRAQQTLCYSMRSYLRDHVAGSTGARGCRERRRRALQEHRQAPPTSCSSVRHRGSKARTPPCTSPRNRPPGSSSAARGTPSGTAGGTAEECCWVLCFVLCWVLCDWLASQQLRGLQRDCVGLGVMVWWHAGYMLWLLSRPARLPPSMTMKRRDRMRQDKTGQSYIWWCDT